MNKSSSMIPVYTIHPPIFHVCNKFQLSRSHSSWEKYDETFDVWKLERKKYEKIKGWIRAAAWFWYIWYIHPFSTCVPSFNLLGLTVPEKKVTKKFHVWKLERKKDEKGWIRAAAAWFRCTQYTCPLFMSVWSFNLLGLTVPEKSWWKISMSENWRERKMKK